MRWLSTRIRLRIPDFLIATVGMAVIVWQFQLAPPLNEKAKPGQVEVVGKIPRELPSFKLPVIKGGQIRELLGNGCAIALLGLLEAIAMAKAIAAQTRQKLDINQQCLSEAVANIGGSMFQCFPGSGSLTRSNINQQSGAVSQWSGVISAVAVALTVVLFAPYARFIPKSALAGILLVSACRLIDWAQLRHYLKTTSHDATIVWVTAISAIAISVEFCVMIGVMMSFVLYIPRAARVYMTELTVAPNKVVRERQAQDVSCNRIHIYSLEGELFFGAVPDLEEHFERILKTIEDGTRVVVLRLKRVRNPDTVCLEVIGRFADELHQRKVTLLFCGVRPDLMKILDTSGLAQRLGTDRVLVFQETSGVWSSTLEAIRIAYELVGQDVCDHCPRRENGLNERADWHFQI